MANETTEAKKPGRFAEIRQGYRAIKQLDGRIGWFMLLAALVTFAVIVGIGFLLGGLWRWYLVLIAIPAALLAATFVMNRRGNKAMYGVLEGQAGAAGAALQSMGRRGWYASTEPVAVDVNRASKPGDMSSAAMVFRALGRPGVVLLGEGPKQRVLKLLKAEERKTNRVAPGVPVHLWVVGDGGGGRHTSDARPGSPARARGFREVGGPTWRAWPCGRRGRGWGPCPPAPRCGGHRAT